MASKNESKSKYEIGDMVHLEGYLQQDVSPRTFFGIVTNKSFNNRSKKWTYDVTIIVNGEKVYTVVQENAILIKTDLN